MFKKQLSVLVLALIFSCSALIANYDYSEYALGDIVEGAFDTAGAAIDTAEDTVDTVLGSDEVVVAPVDDYEPYNLDDNDISYENYDYSNYDYSDDNFDDDAELE